MADLVKELGIKVTIDSSGVEAGAAGVGTALEGAGKKGAEGLGAATTAAKGLGDATQKAGTEAKDALESVLAPSTKLEAQIAKTGNALSPRGIIDGAAKIKIALEDIEAEARRTGKSIGPDLAAQMERAEQAIATAIPRAGRLADTIADTRKQAGLAAEDYKVLGSAGGGLQAVFSSMDDAGHGWVSTLGKIGIAAFGVTQAIGLARDIVRGTTEVIQEHLNKADAWALKMDGVRAVHDRVDLALRSAQRGVIALGGSIPEMVANFDRAALASGRTTAGLLEFAKNAGVTVPQSLTSLKSSAETMGAVLEGAFKRGSAEGLRFATANASQVKQIEDEYRLLGEAVPAGVRKAIDAIAQLEKENQRFADELKALAAAYAFSSGAAASHVESIRSLIRETDGAISAAQREADEVKVATEKKLTALRQMELSDEEYNAEKKKLLAESQAALDEANAKEEAARTKQLEGIRKERQERKDLGSDLAFEAKVRREAAQVADEQNKADAVLARVLQDLKTGTGEITQATIDFAKAQRDAQDSTDQQTKSMPELTQQINEQAGVYDAQRASMEKLAIEHEKHIHRQRELAGEIQKTNQQFVDGSGKIHDMTMGVDGLTAALEKLTA